jgi:hypothetical protein
MKAFFRIDEKKDGISLPDWVILVNSTLRKLKEDNSPTKKAGEGDKNEVESKD